MKFGLIQLASFIVAIGILVTAHEYGHFWVARRLGFKVLRFSIGFGRPLVMRVGRDGVEYVLGMLPLGGYVKLADERDGPVAPADLARAFNRRPTWARVLVLLAGPAANFVFALVAFWMLFMSGVPGLRPVLGDIPLDSPAARAGLRAGDEVVGVNHDDVATREGTVLGILSRLVEADAVELRVRRGGAVTVATLEVPAGKRKLLTEPGAFESLLGLAFTPPHIPTIVGRVAAGGAAAAAGLLVGDEIVAVNGERVADFRDFRRIISARGGETVALDVRRGSADLRIPVAVRAERDATDPKPGLVGRIGIAPGGQMSYPPEMRVLEQHGPVNALMPAVRETYSKTALTVKFLWRMITGDVSLKNVSGPISIANYAGLSALGGFMSFLSFLAVISISLGVLNLLPVPILDGGQIVYQLAEGALGRPVSPRIQMLGQQVGLVLLVMLMSLAFYNDIAQQFR